MSTSDNQSTPAETLFMDDNVLVLNKRPGSTVIPGRGEAAGASLREWAEAMLHEKIFVVHRIDRDTSGIVLFCRNAATHRTLSMQFERRSVVKGYLALVAGEMTGTGTFTGPIHQFGSGRMGVDERGKASTTTYSVAEALSGATLLRMSPLTGRRHQLRVHLCSSGHPVLGDRLYGQERPVGGVERLMLHASVLTLRYPEGTPFTVEAPVDGHWNSIVDRFRPGPNP